MVPGHGLLQCAIYDHIAAGMSALYTVNATVKLDPPNAAPVRTYYIAAELIDWDYAARHDPAWDLAWLAREAGFDPAAEEALLAGYGHPSVNADRLAVLRLLVARVGALWGIARAQQPGLPDAVAWTTTCRTEFEARITDPTLSARVAALR